MADQNPNLPEAITAASPTGPTTSTEPGVTQQQEQPLTPAGTSPTAPKPQAPILPPSQGAPGLQGAAPQNLVDPNKMSMKQHLVGILHHTISQLGEGLGGPADVQGYGTHGETTDANGNPIMEHRSVGQRALGVLGKEMVGMSAGLGAARGPGGVGRATAASAEAVLNLQEKNKAYSMQMHTQHANDYAVYRHQMADQADAMDANEKHDVGMVSLMKNAESVATPMNDGQPMSSDEMLKTFQDGLKQGWKVGDFVKFAGPKEANVPSPSNPQGVGFHPTFYVFRAKVQTPQTGESLAQQKVSVTDPAVAKRMMVADGADVPIYLLAKTSTEGAALNNGVSSIQNMLKSANIDAKDARTIPTKPEDMIKDADAMTKFLKNWIPGDPNPQKALDALKATDSDAANRVAQYFGGYDNVKKISDTNRMAAEKQDAINKDPEKASAPPLYRQMMSKDIGLMKYLDPSQKQAFTDQMNNIPDMTVAQAGAFMNTIYGENFRAMQAQKADEAKAQQAADARAERELTRKMKEGEEPTPEENQATVDAVGQARQQMPLAWARTPQGRAMMDNVNNQYPDYNSTFFNTYEKMRESFAAGVDARTLEAVSKVAQHMGMMYDTVSTASTGVLGSVMGGMQGVVGINTEAGRRAQALKPMVTGISTELDKAYTQGVPTISGIDEWKKTVDTGSVGQNPEAIHERLAAGMELLRGQIRGTAGKWNRIMPHKKDGTPVEAPLPLVTPEFREAYTKITGKQIDEWGNNPAEVTKATAPNQPRDLNGNALKPGTYVVVEGKYYDPANPKIKAAMAAGWKPEMHTVKGE